MGIPTCSYIGTRFWRVVTNIRAHLQDASRFDLFWAIALEVVSTRLSRHKLRLACSFVCRNVARSERAGIVIRSRNEISANNLFYAECSEMEEMTMTEGS